MAYSRGERACPECGSIACPQGEKIRGRRVYGCSNPYCGHVFYRYKGEIVTVEHAPWKRLPRPDDPVYVSITLPDRDRLSLRKRIHRLWCRAFLDSPYPGLERALEDLLARVVEVRPEEIRFKEIRYPGAVVVKEV